MNKLERKWRGHQLWISLLATSFFIFGCGGEDCSINNTVAAQMKFYTSTGSNFSLHDTLTLLAVRPQGDSVILNKSLSTSVINFPLSYTQQTDTFLFQYANRQIDSLFISHENYPFFVSIECGTAMYHQITLLRSTHLYIDTLLLKASEVNYDERENIKVVFGAL